MTRARGDVDDPEVGAPPAAPGRSRVQRLVVVLLITCGLGVLLRFTAIDVLGGAWSLEPEAPLPENARRLIDDVVCADGLELADVVDHHVHALGLGSDGADTWVNPAKLSWTHPWGHLQFLIYTSAAGIGDLEHADRDYMERLVRLARAAGGGERHLLAFDHRYDAHGTIDLARSELFVSNERVLELCARELELFVPVGSLHPYRADALFELQRLAAAGVRWIKWLPNAMGIDPADARCDAFYAALAEHRMLLISHAGEEQAVHAADDQELGNPLRLRRALAAGVTVVVAHCASLGDGLDLDEPARGRVPCFELFLRMMEDPRWQGRLFGELSAVTQINRRHVLRALLEREDLHARLVDGSDYPLPAVNAVISTRLLEREGYLSADERAALNAVYEVNPLLFDLALKRTLHHPESGRRFPAAIFTRRLDG